MPRLKQSSEMDGSRSSDDKAFQAAGPDVENARGPNVRVDVRVLGTTNWLSSANQSYVLCAYVSCTDELLRLEAHF